jgi:hypothetical protein
MKTLAIAACMLAAGAALAAPDPGGRPLAPGAALTNDTGATVYVLLSLADGDRFANDTERSFRVLHAWELRALADALVNQQIKAHEEAIGERETALQAAETELERLRDERAQPPEGSP